ncbi:MAG TPA: BTAD domain-containing putative transcriptional regulator [Gammaproteobacteria bacterium]|nr:BTAD domain-containing putative transcriptional regulator [Gammaproteobacteria bacterium]
MGKSTIDKVSLLGDFRLHTTNDEDVAIRGKKNAALLASILLEPEKRINRGAAESLLWSQRSTHQAKASLRQCLSELREQLENFSNVELITNRLDISLALDKISLDVDEIVGIAASDSIAEKIRFADHCEGEFLKGLNIHDPAFEDWVYARRLHYKDIYQGILKDLLFEIDARSDAEETKHIAFKLLESDICSETAHMALMKCYFNEDGGKAKAIRQYRLCCDLLQKEIDAPPSQDLKDLYERIRTTEPGSQNQIRKGQPEIDSPPRTYGLSVAVFPFNEIDSPERDTGLGSKLARDVRKGLSRFSWLSVASRYVNPGEASRTGGYQKISRDINVRYVVDGYIEYSGDGGRLSIELIDIIDDAKSTISWNQDFDLDIDNNKSLERTAAKIISQLDVKLRQKEIERVGSLPPNEYSAYDCVIRAVSSIPEMTPESFQQAEKLFERAIELDPEFAAIYTWRIYWEIFLFGQSWVKNPAEEIQKVNQITRDALKRDPDDALVLAMKGHFKAFVEHDFESALELHDKAYRLNPCSSMVLLLNSCTFSYCGEPRRAIDRLAELNELVEFEERHKFLYYVAHSIAYTFNRDYELGIEWGKKCISDTPSFTNGYKPIICCLGHLGKTEEAANYIDKLSELDPDFSIEQVAKVYPFKQETDRNHYIEGLRKAGVSH